MKKIILVALLSIILFEFVAIDISSTSDINTIYVNDDFNSSTDGWGINCFSKIQDAINASAKDYTIFVNNGLYFEHLNITKSITIIGEDNNKTIIEGEYNGNIISIISDNVIIKNFTIQNSGEKLNNSGIQILSNNNLIVNNLILNSSIGIYLKQCYKNIVKQNIFENNDYGVGIDYCDNKNEISKNTIINNSITGIYIAHSFNNEVFNNTIIKNNYGIALSFSDKNNIMYNMINESIVDGIYLYFCNEGYISNNEITDGECSIKVISSHINIIDNNIISNFSIYGVNLFHAGSNEVYKNTITNGNTGIFVASDSIDNNIEDNIFSSNNQKILEEPHIEEPSSLPGFEFIVIIIAIFIICLKRKYT